MTEPRPKGPSTPLSSLPLESDLERRLERLGELMRRMIRMVHATEEPYNLTPTQLLVLTHIDEHQKLRVGVLAQTLGAAQNTISEVVSRLERSGLVVKERDAEDNRAVILRLTSKGETALATRRNIVHNQHRALLEAMTADEQQRFVEAFELMVSIAERARDAVQARRENRRKR